MPNQHRVSKAAVVASHPCRAFCLGAARCSRKGRRRRPVAGSVRGRQSHLPPARAKRQGSGRHGHRTTPGDGEGRTRRLDRHHRAAEAGHVLLFVLRGRRHVQRSRQPSLQAVLRQRRAEHGSRPGRRDLGAGGETSRAAPSRGTSTTPRWPATTATTGCTRLRTTTRSARSRTRCSTCCTAWGTKPAVGLRAAPPT